MNYHFQRSMHLGAQERPNPSERPSETREYTEEEPQPPAHFERAVQVLHKLEEDHRRELGKLKKIQAQKESMLKEKQRETDLIAKLQQENIMTQKRTTDVTLQLQMMTNQIEQVRNRDDQEEMDVKLVKSEMEKKRNACEETRRRCEENFANQAKRFQGCISALAMRAEREMNAVRKVRGLDELDTPWKQIVEGDAEQERRRHEERLRAFQAEIEQANERLREAKERNAQQGSRIDQLRRAIGENEEKISKANSLLEAGGGQSCDPEELARYDEKLNFVGAHLQVLRNTWAQCQDVFDYSESLLGEPDMSQEMPQESN